MIDYITLLLLNMTAGHFLLAAYVLRGLDSAEPRDWAPAFVVVGAIGTGKTTLCRAMLDQLDDHYSTALILNPVMDPDQLMKAIALEFGLNTRGADRLDGGWGNDTYVFHAGDGADTIDNHGCRLWTRGDRAAGRRLRIRWRIA